MLLAWLACTPKIQVLGDSGSDTEATTEDTALTIDERDDIAVAIESPASGDTFWEAQAPYVVVRVHSDQHDDLTALDLTWTGAAGMYDDAPSELSSKGEAAFLLPDLAIGEHTLGLEVRDGAGKSGSAEVAIEVLPRDVDGDGHVDDHFDGDDCDDDDPTVYAGAKELCDGIDNDCDEEIDEGC